ncbi:FAD-binding domain [Phenylobacterium montanum]|uniref:FAD-binding domain n=1 Tax=Phenylobacterium montanum TaxID=2823693 RepID=A0A975G1R5_9CAUL|nr:FAD-binding domain [Caulobacter sp. S6]QUD89518.1 FAD-binding domain [Caulobacter sp. S6]
MKIAISGAGVAGPTLAYWLLQAGHTPTLIEASSRLRTGGYMIDFWGVGYTVAERMGIMPQVCAAGYDLEEVRYVDAHGRNAGGISAATIRRELGERFTSLPRGDLAETIYRTIEGRVETIFGTSITSIDEHPGGVWIVLNGKLAREYDLVVGADGLHSNVRALAFGPEAEFERPLGYYVAAFEAEGYAPRDELTYVSYGDPGRQISRFAMRENRTMFLFVFAADQLGGAEPKGLEERRQTLQHTFASMEWEWPRIAQALANANDIYFDRVSQISLKSWSKGRVTLLGDAAACVSLLAGEGTGLAMTEAYVLAGELAADADYSRALERYESRLRPFIAGKQASARNFARSFTPRTAMGVWLRNQAVKLMAVPGLPDLFVGAQMRDAFALPDYGL